MMAGFGPRCSRIRERWESRLSGNKSFACRSIDSREQSDTARTALLLSPIHPDHSALFNRKRQAAMLERQCGVAEQLAAPAMQRRDVRVVVGGNLLEVIDCPYDLAGDSIAFRGHSEQNFQQFDDRSPV